MITPYNSMLNWRDRGQLLSDKATLQSLPNENCIKNPNAKFVAIAAAADGNATLVPLPLPSYHNLLPAMISKRHGRYGTGSSKYMVSQGNDTLQTSCSCASAPNFSISFRTPNLQRLNFSSLIFSANTKLSNFRVIFSVSNSDGSARRNLLG